MSILCFTVAMTRHFQTCYRLHNDRIWANFIHIWCKTHFIILQPSDYDSNEVFTDFNDLDDEAYFTDYIEETFYDDDLSEEFFDDLVQVDSRSILPFNWSSYPKWFFSLLASTQLHHSISIQMMMILSILWCPVRVTRHCPTCCRLLTDESWVTHVLRFICIVGKGWPIWLIKTSCWLCFTSSGRRWATTVATCCPGRMAEHPKSKSMGGFAIQIGHPVFSTS